ncbi:MAG: helix-turn-helix domain-containing protein [Pseudomonadota bacterium]
MSKKAPKTKLASPFLTTKEAAAYLRISVRALEYYRSHGGGPHYRKHGNHVRYPLENLAAWSKKREFEHTGGADQ